MRRWMTCVLMMLTLVTAAAGGNIVLRSDEQKTVGKKTMQKGILEEGLRPDLETMQYYEIEEFETNLPVLYIDTGGEQILKETTIPCKIALLEPNGMQNPVTASPDQIRYATIKNRGASSYTMFDKKQYRIKFYKTEAREDEKSVAIAGMGKHSEWVLHGPYLDKTLMRNRLVYDLADELNGWAPDSRYAEVFVDGDYQGVYLLVEPVTNGENRLNLSKFGLLSGATSYIVDRNRIDTISRTLETYGKVQGYTNYALYLQYPSENKVTKRQWEYVEKDISRFEKALYGDDFCDPLEGYASYIDMDNWVDYFIINEFAMNYDAGNLSTYLYKNLEGKMKLAVWDFNNSFDNYQRSKLDTEGFYTIENSWMNRICQDERFIGEVIKRYRELRETILSEKYIEELLVSYQEELGDAVERNFKIWGYSFRESLLIGKNQDGSSRNLASYEAAVTQLKTTIHNRLSYLDANIEKLYAYCS